MKNMPVEKKERKKERKEGRKGSKLKIKGRRNVEEIKQTIFMYI